MNYLGLSIPRILGFWFDTVARNWFYRLKVVSRNYGHLRQTRRLRGSMAGRNAIVLANGPSVGLLDPGKITRLKQTGDFDVFAVNSYISSPLADIVVPDYYLLSDPAFFFPEKYPHLTERLKRDVARLTEKKITCFVPLEHVESSPFHKKHGYYDRGNMFLNRITITGPRSYISMTAYKALAAACYMGYSNIYICGFDNDYFLNLIVDENNDMFYIDRHFYDKSGDPPSKIRDTNSGSVGELLYSHHFLFKDLEKFNRYPIINLNQQGLVDCFPKQHSLDIYKEDVNNGVN